MSTHIFLTGPELPVQRDFSAVAQFEETFYIIGGVAGSSGDNVVLLYNQEEESWEDAGVNVCKNMDISFLVLVLHLRFFS